MTHTTFFTRRVEAVHPLNQAAIPGAFVAQELTKHAPAGVANRLGQAVVFDQPGHIQLLDLDQAKLVDQAPAQLVQEISPLPGDLLVLASQAQAGFFPTAAPFLLRDKARCSRFKRRSA